MSLKQEFPLSGRALHIVHKMKKFLHQQYNFKLSSNYNYHWALTDCMAYGTRKIQCYIHKNSPVISILSRINPIPRIHTYLFNPPRVKRSAGQCHRPTTSAQANSAPVPRAFILSHNILIFYFLWANNFPLNKNSWFFNYLLKQRTPCLSNGTFMMVLEFTSIFTLKRNTISC